MPDKVAVADAAPLLPKKNATAHHFFLIDILRGFAALAVVVYHSRVDMWVGFREIMRNPASYSKLDHAVAYLSYPVPFFRSGVMLFFLISGFCIHYPYVAGARPFEPRSYAIRRWFRIYPPYLFAVLFTILVEAIRFHVIGLARSTGPKTLATVLMVQNYMHDPGQMVGNGALWSLPIEIELYILYPIFWLTIRRSGLKAAWVMACSVSAAALLVILAYSPLRERFADIGQVGNSLMYWVVWCGGAMLAERVHNHARPYWPRWATVLLAAFVALPAMAGTARGWPIEAQELLWAAFWFLVIGLGLRSSHRLMALPRPVRKALTYLGTISYSLYLIHYPFFKLCALYWLRRDGHAQSNFLVTLAFCLLAIAPATLFYYWFEKPFHGLARRLASRAQTSTA